MTATWPGWDGLAIPQHRVHQNRNFQATRIKSCEVRHSALSTHSESTDPRNPCSPRIRLQIGPGRGALAFTLTEPLLVRARFVARLGDDGGTAEYGIAPSRYLHQRARRGKACRKQDRT